MQRLKRVLVEPALSEDEPGGQPDIAREEAPGQLPSRAHLGELLEIAFFASLMDVEGDATCFTIGYINPALGSRWPHVAIDTRPLTIDTLRRLAPAADPATTTVAVYPIDDTIMIWGLVPHLRADDAAGAFAGLRVVGRARGRIDVGFASSRVASLIGGTLILYDSYLSRTQLAGMAAKLFPAWASSHEFSRELFAVLEMTREMVALSHGGTILVVPAGPLERICGLRLPPRYAVPHPTHSLLSRLLDVPRPAQDASIAPVAALEHPELHESDTRRELRDAARVIAHLTAVDGAVVLTEGLDLLAFGVMIDVAPSTSPVELPTIDPAAPAEMGSRTQQEFGGARHQSAIAFCRAQPASALALVVSRDGTLSAFLRDSHTVLAIRPLDVGLARFGGRL